MTTHKGYALPLDPAMFKTLRELAGVTQSELVEQSGADPRTVRRWSSTHTATEQTCAWLVDRWLDVLYKAQKLADKHPVSIQRRKGDDTDSAVERLAFALLADEGSVPGMAWLPGNVSPDE